MRGERKSHATTTIESIKFNVMHINETWEIYKEITFHRMLWIKI